MIIVTLIYTSHYLNLYSKTYKPILVVSQKIILQHRFCRIFYHCLVYIPLHFNLLQQYMTLSHLMGFRSSKNYLFSRTSYTVLCLEILTVLSGSSLCRTHQHKTVKMFIQLQQLDLHRPNCKSRFKQQQVLRLQFKLVKNQHQELFGSVVCFRLFLIEYRLQSCGLLFKKQLI